MINSITERVQRGASWLDEVRPNWRSQINPDRLDIASGWNCVLGQVFHGESRGGDSGFIWAIDTYAQPYAATSPWQCDLGFAFTAEFESTLEEENALLVEAWRQDLVAA